MGLTFFLGTNADKKRHHLIQRLHNFLQQNPEQEFFYIVPENVKFEAERMILNQSKDRQKDHLSVTATMQVHVYSFNRLAWHFLQHDPVYQRPILTDSGMSMIIREILSDLQSELKVYRGQVHHRGFIQRMVDQLREFQEGNLTPELILDFLENKDLPQDTMLKMKDLALIYKRFLEQSRHYFEQNQLLDYFIQKLPDVGLSNIQILIDGFESFSAKEMKLILALSEYAKAVSINLSTDLDDVNSHLIDNDPTRTFRRLSKDYSEQTKGMAAKVFSENEWAIEGFKTNGKEQDIQDLLDYWKQSSIFKPFSKNELKSDDTLQLWEAYDQYAEILHISNQINQLIASGKYRYSDIQILSRDLETYELTIKYVFSMSEIPYFIDHSRSMSDHPLAELVEILLTLAHKGARSEEIIRLLKSEMILPISWKLEKYSDEQYETLKDILRMTNSLEAWRHAVDTLENSVLAYGIDYDDWLGQDELIISRYTGLSEEDESYDPISQKKQQLLNLLRDFFQDFIVPHLNALKEAKTHQEMASTLIHILVDLGVREQLINWHDEEMSQDRLSHAHAHEKIWTQLTILLDEFVEIFGDQPADLSLFADILETGFEHANYGMIPPTMDQVQVSHLERPGIQEYPIVFIIGLTNMILPRSQDSKSVLTDEDRILLGDVIQNSGTSGIYLAPTAIEQMSNESFIAFNAFKQASEKLILSYPLKDHENKEMKVSPYLEQIQKQFQLNFQVKPSHSLAPSFNQSNDILDFIGSHSLTHHQILLQFRQQLDHLDEELMNPFWGYLYKLLRQPQDHRQNRIYASLTNLNIPENLASETVIDLYGKDLYLSVSQLELYYKDPFSHFLTYGLKAKPRVIQELTPLEAGIFYHDALEKIVQDASALQLFENISYFEKLKELSENTLKEFLHSKQYPIFQTSNRMKFRGQLLANDVMRTVWALAYQIHHSAMSPTMFEVVFGAGGENALKGKTYQLENGGKLALRGKIDRIDQMLIDDTLYLSVVDYKSSAKGIKANEIYTGLMMQIILYLNIATQDSQNLWKKPVKPAGMFYSQVHNPILKISDLKNSSAEHKLLSKFKLSGAAITDSKSDHIIPDYLDQSGYEGNSLFYPLYKKKDGSYGARSSIFSDEEFKLLANYIDHLVMRAGNDILSGKLILAPYEDHRQTTPSLNEYRAISQFDRLLAENNYRESPKMSFGQLFERIKNLGKEDE